MGMISIARTALAPVGIEPRAVYQSLSARSLRAAHREQGLAALCDRLREITPDLRDQYTTSFDEGEYTRYWEVKMRGLHAFQMRSALDALESVGGDGLVVADIGDSSGNHAAYIHALTPENKISRFISVNLDAEAVDKIRAKGGEAILCRAEDLSLEGVRPDLIVSFETIEHLTDPARFLHGLAANHVSDHLLITVPYRRDSRFGGAHMRMPEGRMAQSMTAEEVHIFEFSPDDWTLLARFAGWKPVFRRTYLQYPKFSALRLTAPLWRKLDFEGFLALFLERDLGLAQRYADW